MALELLRGHTVQAILGERGALPWPEALSLAERVAEGLHHAHEHGIVHRDVKPANIMVLESGQPKVMDFGIAKLESSQLTMTGQLFGTPLYMSPEQAQAGAVDARSDIFSLGAVLYEMLTGRRAFAGDSVHGIVFQVIQADPPPPSSVEAGIPGDVDRLVARCLAKDPGARYQSGRELAEDARAVLAGGSLRARAGEQPAEAAATLVSSRSPLAVARGAARPVTVARPRLGVLLAGALVVVAAVVVGSLARGRLAPPELPAQPSPDPGLEGSPAPALSLADRFRSLVPGSEPAQVSVDFAHSLKSGTLRVFVDDEEVIEADLDSRVTRRFAGIDLRKGTLRDSFDVAPGRHEIRVRVAWGGNVKDESIWGNFQPGSKRRLEARLRGVGGLQDLSLKWR
jgi:serine/threonine-protein kinase